MNEERKKSKSKLLIIIPIIIIIVIIILLIIKFLQNNYINSQNSFNYDRVVELINNQDTAIIYYYNSKSNNKNNVNIKKYLDEQKINYYAYDDASVSKEEYRKFLSLFNIDENIFGLPAIIYIRNGQMYSNLININDNKTVKSFIDDYDLYIVKN